MHEVTTAANPWTILIASDPKFYTRPFTVKIQHDLVADKDIFESFCENEKDAAHIVKP